MTDKPEWKPFSEMPADMTSVFMGRADLPAFLLASKGRDGVWRANFGLVSAEITEPETYMFLPLAIIPPVPGK